jgi:hypothetical protein
MWGGGAQNSTLECHPQDCGLCIKKTREKTVLGYFKYWRDRVYVTSDTCKVMKWVRKGK